jgi:hypothetical protein
VPAPERLVRELYGYLKPGGVWIVYEHVKTKETGWIEWYQGMFLVSLFSPSVSLSLSLLSPVERSLPYRGEKERERENTDEGVIWMATFWHMGFENWL